MIIEIDEDTLEIALDVLDDYCSARGQRYNKGEAMRGLHTHCAQLSDVQCEEVIKRWKREMKEARAYTLSS